MANILKGKDVAEYIDNQSIEDIKKGLNPCLAIFKVGNKDNDSAYERGIDKKAEKLGVKVIKYNFELDAEANMFYDALDRANNDENIHGILVFRPLPKQLDETLLNKHISFKKDVDACLDESLAGVFIGSNKTFAPCTAQAVIELLDYYNIDVKGKNVVVLGRSLVIGKPVSMLLLKKDATVTICHSKSKDIKKICQGADILVCATGQMESITKEYTNVNQTIIDVGINFNEVKNKLCGDVLFENVEPNVKNITPVPGGVGSITTSILLRHVVLASR